MSAGIYSLHLNITVKINCLFFRHTVWLLITMELQIFNKVIWYIKVTIVTALTQWHSKFTIENYHCTVCLWTETAQFIMGSISNNAMDKNAFHLVSQINPIHLPKIMNKYSTSVLCPSDNCCLKVYILISRQIHRYWVLSYIN